MLEHSVYSVISPEGCASILWRSADKVAEACQAMKMTAREIKALGVADEVVSEPLGGAHHDYDKAASNLQEGILRHLKELSALSGPDLRKDRQRKFRKLGAYNE
jgi:acetyl-CoA carboxylase carboxyl transferase subunit alpha